MRGLWGGIRILAQLAALLIVGIIAVILFLCFGSAAFFILIGGIVAVACAGMPL